MSKYIPDQFMEHLGKAILGKPSMAFVSDLFSAGTQLVPV